MKWPRKDPPEPGGPGQRTAAEFLDQDHPRASVADGDRLVINPGKVLENITVAMERVDLDIDTPISIEEDVASADEIVSLARDLRLGPVLAVHVVNTAMGIMAARYPAELVHTPLPPPYDLRKMIPLELSDQQHETAKMIFNRRTTRTAELTPDDIPELRSLAWQDQVQVFVALVYMYGTKVGALKHRTGIA